MPSASVRLAAGLSAALVEEELPSGLRVLLADDMPLNNKLLGHALRKCRADWVIESCLSVDEALEMEIEAKFPQRLAERQCSMSEEDEDQRAATE